MSYLDQPRINFGGTFQASPATINNTPNNYNPANYNADSLKPENIELYWEPKGDSIFNLINCRVTTVDAPDGPPETLLNTPVVALYTSSPPKLVDLDPMQQNGSEIWGLTMMFGTFEGAYVQGTFEPIPFNGIWGNSQGQNTPRNSASGSAVYFSSLTNLKWNVRDSEVLRLLQAQSPTRLSIRMVVSAHNNAPQQYAFTSDTFGEMSKAGVPNEVLNKISSLQSYVMNTGGKLGFIPTLQYVDYLLQQLLEPSELTTYGPTILAVAKQPYVAWIDYSTGEPLPNQPLYGFNYGKIVGSLGPSAADEPMYVVPARTLAPVPAPQRQTTDVPPPSIPPPSCWWAPAKLDTISATPSLTIDLANSLPVPLPGRPVWQERLGTLSLAYYTVLNGVKTYHTFVDSIGYADPAFMDERAGMLVITDFGLVNPQDLENLPIAVLSSVGDAAPVPLLEENPSGLSMRADQFMFRMNPGMETTPSFPRGRTNVVDIYVRSFGRVEGTEALIIGLSVLSQSEAFQYTRSTLGTSGTQGLEGISNPPGKLQPSAPTVRVSNGKASVPITGLDPGNPRGFVDGQVYFLTYDFSPPVEGFALDPNDLVSVQIYQQNPIVGTPTWNNGIGEILRQYGMLYPIMGRFELWSYEGVKANHEKIERVLSMGYSLPLHMPVTRDLSETRRQLILEWFQAGMPE